MQIFNLPNGDLVSKDGKIKDEWQKSFSSLFQQAQRELGTEGFLIPSQQAATVDVKSGVENSGLLVVDIDRNALVINLNGVLYTVNVTAI